MITQSPKMMMYLCILIIHFLPQNMEEKKILRDVRELKIDAVLKDDVEENMALKNEKQKNQKSNERLKRNQKKHLGVFNIIVRFFLFFSTKHC